MTRKAIKTILILFALSVAFLAQSEGINSKDIDRLANESGCKEIVDKTSDFTPMLNLIIRPDDFNCSIVRTRGFIYFKNIRNPSLYSEPSKQHFGLLEYSVVLPSNSREGLKFNGREVFVNGLFMKYDSDRTVPHSAGVMFEVLSVTKGSLYDAESNL